MIDSVTDRYLHEVDEALPGFVEGLHLVGSVALGAWQPERSDIDTVVVTSRPAGADDLVALARVHAGMPHRPHLDGVYLDVAAFAERPTDHRAVPFVIDGVLHTGEPCFELTPVLWLTLRRYGVPVRGPAASDAPGAEEDAALRRYNLDNLRDYWRPLAAHTHKRLAEYAADAPIDPEIVAWAVLGPARLHYTLAHADVISKARAGAYLAELFPRWASLAQRAVRWRAGEPESFTASDLGEAARSVDAVIDDAWARWGGATA